MNSIYAQKGLEIQYSAKKIEVGEQLIVVYNLTNLNERNIILPKYDPLIFLGGPSVSRSMNTSIINGHMSQSSTNSYTIYITGKKIGKFKVPKCEFVLADGSKIATNELDIEIVKQGTLPRQQQQQNPYDPFAGMYDPFDPFGGMTSQGRPQQKSSQQPSIASDPSKINLKNDVFARIQLNKSKVYVGEQIYATVKIYTSVNSNGFEAEKVPNFNGFWSQDIKMPEKLELKKEIINGKEFVSVEIKKMILFPTKAGVLEISPLKMKTVALVPVQIKPNRPQPRDLFEMLQQMMSGNMGGVEYKQIPYSFSSGSEKVTVLPLPEGAPKSFTGAVGNFKMNAYCNKKALKTDEALSYNIEVTGTGNLPLIENPIVEWNEDLESYEPTLKENFNHIPSFNGTKTWEYTVIPHNPGKYNTPNFEFTYFDLGLKKYITLHAEATDLTITGNPTKSKNKSKSYEQQNLANKKIEPIISSISFDELPINLIRSLLFIPFLLTLLCLLIPRFKPNENNGFVSDKKVKEIIKKQMKKAHVFLVENKKKEYYTEVHQAILGFIAHKLKMETSLMSKENITSKLIVKQVEPELIDKLIALLDDCEMSLYSNQEAVRMQENYDNTIAVLSSLDSQIS